MLNEENEKVERKIRQAIDFEQFKKLLERNNSSVNQQLAEILTMEVAWLKQEAEQIILEFDELKAHVKKTRTLRDWSTLEVLIRVNKYSFAIEWRQILFKKINGHWRVFYHLMQFNHKTLIYSFHKAKNAKSWELEKAIHLEGKFKVIRSRLKKLIAFRQNMRV